MAGSGNDFSENLQDQQSQLLKKLQDACVSNHCTSPSWKVRQLPHFWLEASSASHSAAVFKVQGAAVLQRVLPGRALEVGAQAPLQEACLGQRG